MTSARRGSTATSASGASRTRAHGGPGGSKHDPSRFHPQQVRFAGPGAADVMRRVGAALSRDYLVGYAALGERPADGGHAGLDGRTAAGIAADGTAVRYERHGEAGLFERSYALLECDIVLSEGGTGWDGPTVLLLGDEGGCQGEDTADDVIATVGAGPGGPDHSATHLHPDDVEGVAAALASRLLADASARPLYGLVLAGGKSTRMGRDKWGLDYRGAPHAHVLHGLLAAHCERAFLSIRPEQRAEPELARLPHIVDKFEGLGPLSGILSAMTAHPEAAWVVLACDLPGVKHETIRRLLASRAPLRFATCYRSPGDGLPEPLVAVYEPKSRLRLFQVAALGYDCPRKMLIHSRTTLLESPEPWELTNVNDPDDYQRALSALRPEEVP